MKDEWNNILLSHYKRYPLMEVEDYIKLIYQSTFGPYHFQGNPNYKNVSSRIESELSQITSSYNLIEDIGNDYVRVHLGAIKENRISIDEVIEAFINSMNDYLNVDSATINFMLGINYLKIIVTDVQNETKAKESILKIDEYLKSGIRPIHHSQTYRDNYYPHYRVIAKKHLIDIG
jgi:hypothetical protein